MRDTCLRWLLLHPDLRSLSNVKSVRCSHVVKSPSWLTVKLSYIFQIIPRLLERLPGGDITEMLHSWWMAESHLDRLLAQYNIKAQVQINLPSPKPSCCQLTPFHVLLSIDTQRTAAGPGKAPGGGCGLRKLF